MPVTGFRSQASGTVAADGTVTLTFPPGPANIWYQGTVNCPSQSSSAQFLVVVDGVVWTSIFGNNPASVNVRASQQVQLKGTGLIPTSVVTAQFIGTQTDQGPFGTAPTPSPTGTLIAADQRIAVTEQSFTASAGPPRVASFPCYLQGNERLLTIMLWNLAASGTPTATVTVTGQTTGRVYGTFPMQAPDTHLGATPAPQEFNCEVFGTADPEVLVQVGTSGGMGTLVTGTVLVIAQPDLYAPLQIVTGASPLGGTAPLDVVPYGGVLASAISVTAGMTVAFLGTPLGGTAWRLHAWSIQSANQAVQLVGHSSGNVLDVLYVPMNVGTYRDSLDGQIMTEGVDAVGLAGGGNTNAVLFYDAVALPSIS